MDSVQTVRAFYDSQVATEWERLAKHPFEFEITKRMLRRTIRPGERVLDIGGGPGRYSLYLASIGCDVTLLDLSENNVAFALEQAAANSLPLRAIAGDARNAHELAGRHDFDHVLLMGPLYHLLAESDRRLAVESALRCLLPGGRLYASFILMFSGFIYMMKYDPELILGESEKPFIEHAIKNASYGGAAFTDAHFTTLDDIRALFAPYPLQKVTLFGQESVLSPCEDRLVKASPEALERWIDSAVALCERPDLLAWAEHVMYVGQKI